MSAHGFDDVDARPDPGAFVGYLERARTELAAQKRLLLGLQRARPGDHLLDVGCGTGDDALALAERVGPEGLVVGIDNSETMIAEARRRAGGSPLRVKFRIGDAHVLDFPDDAFDGSRAERVFQHLRKPDRALAELVRVTRPGGRLVVGDPDWGTLVIAASDDDLTRRITAFLSRVIPSSTVARNVPGMMRRLGLEDVEVTPATLVLERYDAAADLVQLTSVLDAVGAAGAIELRQLERWRDDLRARDDEDSFFLALSGFITTGVKPA